jgi:hypothetical protein
MARLPDSQYEPGGYGCHEALHTIYVVKEMFEQHVLEHPAIERNAIWLSMSDDIAVALFKLYQKVGEKHLGEAPSKD